jgi:hypothetical protein
MSGLLAVVANTYRSQYDSRKVGKYASPFTYSRKHNI